LNGKVRLFIHAANVHQGGGRSLLNALLTSLPDGISLSLSVDHRLSLPEIKLEDCIVNRVTPSIAGRLKAEKWLADNVGPGDLVLCFGNLPPLFKLKGRIMVFVQNRYLVDSVKLNNFRLKTRLRLGIERLWFNRRIAFADEIIVQTPSMKNLLGGLVDNKAAINVLPFMKGRDGYKRNISSLQLVKASAFDFLYVASGDPHKNHRQLIKAWCLLAREGLFPSLRLTIDNQVFSGLCAWITGKSDECKLNVENVGNLDDGRIGDLYNQAGALIYPSTLESFGLPLIEARQANLPVLASELDYVRDVLDPDQSFDPSSEVSIARAVKRFMGLNESVLPLVDAKAFFAHILKHESR
jgi:glycosyltransferase involved in cell wall biosynthesis